MGSLTKLTEVIRIKVIQLSLCFRTPSVANCCQLLPSVAYVAKCCQVLPSCKVFSIVANKIPTSQII